LKTKYPQLFGGAALGSESENQSIQWWCKQKRSGVFRLRPPKILAGLNRNFAPPALSSKDVEILHYMQKLVNFI
jgi:hypothetical protein